MGCCESVESDNESVRDYPRPCSSPVTTYDNWNRTPATHDTTSTHRSEVRVFEPARNQPRPCSTLVTTYDDWYRTPATNDATSTRRSEVRVFEPARNQPSSRSPRPYDWSIYSEQTPTGTHPPVKKTVPVPRSTKCIRPSNNTRPSTNIKPVERTFSPVQHQTDVFTNSPEPVHRSSRRSPEYDVSPIEISVSTLRTTFNRPAWDIHELLAETKKIDTTSAKNIVQLFEGRNTIPFICRYRRDLINHKITPDRLRDIKNAYTEIVSLRKRSETVISDLEKVGVINEEIRGQILCVKTVKELEFLQAIYKPTKKTARELGLEMTAHHLILGISSRTQLHWLIDYTIPELNTITKVKDVLCEAISLQFSTNINVLNQLRRLQNTQKFVLKSTKTERENESVSTNDQEQLVYEKYFDFKAEVRQMKSHQILAINRGEKLGFLSVEIIGPDNFQSFVRSYIFELYMCQGLRSELRSELFDKAFKECYSEKLFPLVCRQVRANLTEKADKEAVEVFAKNLKDLLLMPPLKGEPILGIDPGFRHGCKLALISETADLLGVTVLHPHKKRKDPERDGVLLAKMLERHSCKVIALGNGTACRETESWLRELFEKGVLDGQSINYAIVSEQGASVYSCSDDARREFPLLDVNLISAVSIARRLNDPLSEYAKIEPQHLGIGMYQHDINENFLSKSLNEVVSQCVSFVGVDINTASLSLLKHVAGLNEDRAKSIIQYRQKYGPFRTRNDLKLVPSVEEEAFVQCAGFIRIEPKSVGGSVDNILDCTWVHPESYAVANKIIKQCKLELSDIGKPHFISKIKSFDKSYSTATLVNHYGIHSERVKAVLAALQRELFQDYRRNFDKKLFKREITQIEDLFVGEIVTGEVRNVVRFGAFVDIGLKSNALIPNRHMDNKKLQIGNRVSATVLEVDVYKKHIQLRLDELI